LAAQGPDDLSSCPTQLSGTALAMRMVMRQRRLHSRIVCLAIIGFGVLGACSKPSTVYVAEKTRPYDTDSVETHAHKVGVVQGFYGPESVRYSPGQDVYFVSVMNGPGSDKDDNGYIVKINAANLGESQLFAVGGKNGVHLDA